MAPLTPTEIEELRIAIATEMGWKKIPLPPNASWGQSATWPEWYFTHQLPPYTTSIDSIQAACLERFKDKEDGLKFALSLSDEAWGQAGAFSWQLTALDWCIAFARTSKIWRYKV